MARLIVLYNPLDTSRRRAFDLPAGTPLLDWLDKHEPAPRECVRDVYLNGAPFDGSPDYQLQVGDELLVVFRPAWVQLGMYVLQALIAAAVSYVVSRLFAPSKPKAGNTPAPSQVYGISTPRNAARLGEPIPVIYGTVIALPDYAAQPYTEYIDNEQHLRAIVCLGQGEYQVGEMLLGDSSAASLPAGVASFMVFSPAEHASTFGVIAAASGVRENVCTSADVADQELLPPNIDPVGLKWVGPFESCKAGQAGNSIECDFVFPGGLYSMDGSGNLGTAAVQIEVEATPINDDGVSIGPAQVYLVTYSTASNTTQRYTFKIPVPLGRYRVRCSRQTDSDGKASTSDRVNWTGLKFDIKSPAPSEVYGNVTLIAVKLKATNGISSDAASSIRFRVTRRLPPPAGGALAGTVNPADAFADVLCAPYGGNRPRNGDELDLAALDAARARWSGHNGFNAVFDQPSTVWEALSLTVQTVSAAPLPIGSRMTVIQDGVQPDRVQHFGDGNIVKGTLQVAHSFDRDGTPAGIRVEYRDPRTFSAAALLDPIDAPDYETVNLFGCTSREVAAEHATLLRNRRRLARKNISFETELEGLNCLPGDRIGVQAGFVRWAQFALVERVDGLILSLDRALSWEPGQAHALQLRDPFGKPYTVRNVQPGSLPHQVVVPSLPFAPVTRDDAIEPTSISFGVDGREVTDWTVTAMQPQGATVAIQAVNYEPEVWTGAAAHLQIPAVPNQGQT